METVCKYHQKNKKQKFCSACYSRQYRAKFPEKFKNYYKKWKSNLKKSKKQQIKKYQKDYFKKWLSNPKNKEKRSQYYKRKRNEYRIKSYGLTIEDKEKILRIQGGVCAICKQDKPLVIDHDHLAGKNEKEAKINGARGFLCNNCNTTLSQIERVSLFAEYAREYLTNPPIKQYKGSLK